MIALILVNNNNQVEKENWIGKLPVEVLNQSVAPEVIGSL